jgi:hypothetical protein
MTTKTINESAIQFKVSPSLKKEIFRSALERNETVRVFILRALKGQGIPVSESELVDRRGGSSR